MYQARAEYGAALPIPPLAFLWISLDQLDGSIRARRYVPSETLVLIRCLKLTAVANVVMREDLPQMSPAWQLARQIAEVASAPLPSRPLKLLDALWTDAAVGAENDSLKRRMPASAYLLAVFKALRCEDGMILECGAFWIGTARAWCYGRVPVKQIDEPEAYTDLEREFESLYLPHASVLALGGRALASLQTPMQDAQGTLDLSSESEGIDIAAVALAAERRAGKSQPIDEGEKS